MGVGTARVGMEDYRAVDTEFKTHSSMLNKGVRFGKNPLQLYYL